MHFGNSFDFDQREIKTHTQIKEKQNQRERERERANEVKIKKWKKCHIKIGLIRILTKLHRILIETTCEEKK